MTDALSNLLNPEYIVLTGGLLLIFIVAFAENGLPVGVVLPGESLLFVAGVYSHPNLLEGSSSPLPQLLVTAFVAVFSGSLFGYYTGLKSGPLILERPDGRFYKRRYLSRARLILHRYRALALLIGRFIPVVRTLMPIAAGILKMPFRTFFFYNLLSISVYTPAFVLMGYWAGHLIPDIRQYLVFSLIGLALLFFGPVLAPLLKKK